VTHFLNFLRARWCASRPSERDLRALTSTWVRPPPPPYHRTQTVIEPGGPSDSTFPGQAGLPLAAPHTRSPTISFHWVPSSTSFVSATEGSKEGTIFFRDSQSRLSCARLSNTKKPISEKTLFFFFSSFGADTLDGREKSSRS